MDDRSEFTDDVITAAHRRQHGVCAHCGTPVSWDDQAHAVLAPGSGTFAGELDNCVILCFNCRTWVFIEPGAVGGPGRAEDFPFSHGRRNPGGHKVWANRMGPGAS